jgi:hypothetical protein
MAPTRPDASTKTRPPVYLRCVEYLADLMKRSVTQELPKFATHGEALVNRMFRAAFEHGDSRAAKILFDLLVAHDETLANANLDAEEDEAC